MPKRPWTPYAVLCGTELRFLRAVCRFSPWNVFSFENRLSVTETGIAGIGGFGLGLLGGQGFIGAKAPLDP